MDGPARLALGAAQLGMAYGVANHRGALAEAEAKQLLLAAVRLGIDCVDTAPAYGDSEARIGRFLRTSDVGLRVITKLRPPPPGLSEAALGEHVHTSVERSLSALGRSSVHVLLLHGSQSLDEYGGALLRALRAEQQLGRIEHLGLSIYDPSELELARKHPELTALQFPFNLFDRRFAASGRLEAWLKPGRLSFARSALLQGLFTLDPMALPTPLEHTRPWLMKLRDVLRELELDPVTAALGFARAESRADYVVVGAESPEQLQGWANNPEPLSADMRARLAAAFEDVPARVFDPRQWKDA